MKSSLNLRRSASHIAEGALVVMVMGLFLSRALLSVGIFLFFLSAPFRLGIRDWLRSSLTDPLVRLFGILWLLPVISGGWSDDTQAWMDVVRIKLPLLLLPMGWVGLSLSNRSFMRIGWILTGLTVAGVLYSLLVGYSGPAAMVQEYLRGKTLITPLDNDRVRFSWLVVAVLFWMHMQWPHAQRNMRWLGVLISVFLVLYLHVLGVRIGLLSFYMLGLFLLIHGFLKKALRVRMVVLFIFIVVLPLLMYSIFPTFRARVDYIRYDWSYTFQGKYLSGGNDAIRVQSLRVAGQLVCESPIYGVGFGDIRPSMDAVYLRRNSALAVHERIYPANEWAVYGVGMGWIGLIALTCCVLALFFVSSGDLFYWRSWVLATVLSLITDIGLEVQHGVFLIPFLLMFLRSREARPKNQEIRS